MALATGSCSGSGAPPTCDYGLAREESPPRPILFGTGQATPPAGFTSKRTVDASVVVPTFQERDCIQQTLRSLDACLSLAPFSSEILVVDDNSPDGTARRASLTFTSCPKRVFVRVGERGLATAVLHGIGLAAGRACLVLAADGSHPPDLAPDLIQVVLEGRAEMAIASRFSEGGETRDWPLTRKMISLAAALAARPLTDVRDPMSGFFAFNRDILRRSGLSPLGYKIGLEILARCRPDPVLEVPYVFSDREVGESKLGSLQILLYLQHLSRLYRSQVSSRIHRSAGQFRRSRSRETDVE